MRPPLVDHVSLYTSDEKKLLFGEREAPAGEDRARQEFKAESDTAYLLHRYGVPNVLGDFGVMDYEMSLQSALQAQEEARQAFSRLPLELRQKYGSWDRLYAATVSGEYKGPEGGAGGSSPAASGASPSDSAAGSPP